MTIEIALELIDCIEKIFLLGTRPNKESIAMILRALLRLRDAPAPPDILRISLREKYWSLKAGFNFFLGGRKIVQP